MPGLQDTEDLFSIFHDGVIAEWAGNYQLLTLTIECRYLAERIDPSFRQFTIELSEISTLSFETWPNPFELPVETFVEPWTIFAAPLEILSATIKNDLVEIVCNQHDIRFDYCGGLLRIGCNGIRVFDQHKRELTIPQLDTICNAYWNDFGRGR